MVLEMKTVNIHDAKTHLSRLVEAAAKGEPFIIAKAGKPLVKVVPVDAPTAPRRLGFMRAVTVPDDFDTMEQEEIEKLFYGDK
jgi:prevent-host-death family protein